MVRVAENEKGKRASLTSWCGLLEKLLGLIFIGGFEAKIKSS